MSIAPIDRKTTLGIVGVGVMGGGIAANLLKGLTRRPGAGGSRRPLHHLRRRGRDHRAVKPLLDACARQVFHMGPVGQGLAMKLVNNMLFQVGTVAVAEAMVLGAKAGLEPQAMIDVIRQSTGHSVAFEMRAPRYLSGNFEPGGTVDITWKDQTLQTDFANTLGVPLFLANVTRQIFQWARGMGYNKKDSSITVTMYEQAAGVQLGPREPPTG